MAIHTPEQVKWLSQEVLDGMASGLSLRKSCVEIGLAVGTFLLWVSKDETLAEQYRNAREELLHKMAEEILVISDEPVGTTDHGGTDTGAVAKQKLQVDSRKWLLSKLAPKQYGDKVEQTMIGADGGPVKQNLTIEFVDAPKRD